MSTYKITQEFLQNKCDPTAQKTTLIISVEKNMKQFTFMTY